MELSRFTATLLALDSLSIYRGLLRDEVLSKLKKLLISLDKGNISLRKAVNLYNDFYFALAQSGAFSLKNYILNSVIFDVNPFTLSAQSTGPNVFENAAANDLRNLQLVSQLNPALLKAQLSKLFAANTNTAIENNSADLDVPSSLKQQIIENLPDWSLENQSEYNLDYLNQLKEKFYTSRQWDACLPDLKDFHQTYGYGIYARYKAFVWERTDGRGLLKGIDRPDPITLPELIDYQSERSGVIENTLLFLKGCPANNVLLYGDRGTGKSSTVKAILNEYHDHGLRMLEVPKDYLADFPLIVRQLKDIKQKFIIFIDDLVFGDNEENYTSLKAMLEGSLECKAPNLVIYATSNRRHLVKEYFSERAGLQSGNPAEEVHAKDSMQEKLSLADRFGLRIVFTSPDQNRYLRIVEGLAARRNLAIEKERLQEEALQWALRYNGRSARTAKQFVDWLEGQAFLQKNESFVISNS